MKHHRNGCPINHDKNSNLRRFQDLMDRLFMMMSPIFGVVETSIFLTRGLALNENQPVADHDISVTAEGVLFTGEPEALGSISPDDFNELLTNYLSRVIYIVRRLTGELLNDDFYRVAEETLGDATEVTRRVFAFRLIEQGVANGT